MLNIQEPLKLDFKGSSRMERKKRMNSLLNEAPSDLNVNHEKFLKIFSKRSMKAALAILPLSLMIYFGLRNYTGSVWALILAVIPEGISYGLTSIKIPEDSINGGAGLYLEQMIFRLIQRKMNKVIYTSAYRGGEHC